MGHTRGLWFQLGLYDAREVLDLVHVRFSGANLVGDDAPRVGIQEKMVVVDHGGSDLAVDREDIVVGRQ